MVEELLDRAFGPDRHARTAYRIRAGMQCLDALSFAALDADEMLVGTIQCWPIALIDREGRVIDYYSSFTSPESKKIVTAIERLL